MGAIQLRGNKLTIHWQRTKGGKQMRDTLPRSTEWALLEYLAVVYKGRLNARRPKQPSGSASRVVTRARRRASRRSRRSVATHRNAQSAYAPPHLCGGHGRLRCKGERHPSTIGVHEFRHDGPVFGSVETEGTVVLNVLLEEAQMLTGSSWLPVYRYSQLSRRGRDPYETVPSTAPLGVEP